MTDSIERTGSEWTVTASGFAVAVAESTDSGRVVSPHGELDLDTAPALWAALSAEAGDVRVDLSRLTFVDSSGLNCLVKAQQRIHAAGGRFILLRPTEPVVRVLELTGLTEQFDIEAL